VDRSPPPERDAPPASPRPTPTRRSLSGLADDERSPARRFPTTLLTRRHPPPRPRSPADRLPATPAPALRPARPLRPATGAVSAREATPAGAGNCARSGRREPARGGTQTRPPTPPPSTHAAAPATRSGC